MAVPNGGNRSLTLQAQEAEGEEEEEDNYQQDNNTEEKEHLNTEVFTPVSWK